MSHPDYEMVNMSSPNQNRPPVPPKNHPNTEVMVPHSERSSRTFRESTATTTAIPHRPWPVFLVLLYAALALTSWVLLCIMSHRPIRGEKSYYETEDSDSRGWFAINERYYLAARIIQSIVNLITIPVTSAICSVACVAYMQVGRARKSLTLRQAMALADQGWINPLTWVRVGKLGSLPLYVAFVLTLLGCVFQVLQSVFVKQELTLAGSDKASLVEIADIPRLASSYDGNGHIADRSHTTAALSAQLRGLLETTDKDDLEPHLWGNFPALTLQLSSRSSGIQRIGELQRQWPDEYEDRYIVALPREFSTGAHPQRQFAPRMNSSLQYTNVTQEEWKRECRNETENGGFYALYEYVDNEYDWTTEVEACMTSDLRETPWSATRDRQDITETLYLRVNFSSLESGPSIKETGPYFKAEVKSTLGYFELPSQANGNIPGPLRDFDPIPRPGISDQSDTIFMKSKRDVNTSYSGNQTLLQSHSRGPLAALTMALFGPESFVATRLSNTSAYVVERPQRDAELYPMGNGNCIALMPLGSFFSSITGCVQDSDALSETRVVSKVNKLLEQLAESDSQSMMYLLRPALYMANKLWLRAGDRQGEFNPRNVLRVHYDEGQWTTKPKIGVAWKIVGSLLLGLHLLGLLILTLYSFGQGPWKASLGAEVMVRMGAAYADELGDLGGKMEWRNVMGRVPGFVGDECPAERVGRIRVGASEGLVIKDGRRFEDLR